jgi:hypothetical protein
MHIVRRATLDDLSSMESSRDRYVACTPVMPTMRSKPAQAPQLSDPERHFALVVAPLRHYR